MQITSSVLSVRVLKFSALIFCLLYIDAASLFAQKKEKIVQPQNALNTFSTSNTQIWANVDGSTGRVNVLLPPGSITSGSLSFPDHSYFTCKIDSTVFTNNDRFVLPPNVKTLNDGNTVKIADTIKTTWSNKAGVDIIQDIYPVAFLNPAPQGSSGQIVYKWSFHNNNSSPIAIACQYLQDLDIFDPTDNKTPDANDGPTVLTKWSYQPDWQQYPNNFTGQGVPPFFIGFLHDLPNGPNFFPNLSGQGYFDFPGAPLNLIKPFRVTIGDWSTMANTIFGARPSWPVNGGARYGNDNGILLEFTPQGVPAGKTVEIGRTSYGTGQFETCIGDLFSLVFYPHHLVWTKTPSPGFYTPNPIHIEKFVVYAPNKPGENKPAATNTQMTLTVGDDMNLTDSIGTINIGKSQTKPDTGPGMFLAPGDVGYFDWWAWTSPALFCKAPDIDTLLFTGTSSLGPPTFLNSQGADECDQLITIDCAEADVDPPLFSDSVYSNHSAILTVSDSRTTDRGLQSITWVPENKTDTTKFIVSAPIPPIGACYTDKAKHTVTITQKDSTIGGCFDFTFTDCLAHQSFTTVCLVAHLLILPDTLAPIIQVTADNNVSGRWSIMLRDDRQYDKGLDTFYFLSDTNIHLPLSLPAIACLAAYGLAVTSLDTTKNSSFCIRVIDCAKNYHDTCVFQQGKPDTTNSFVGSNNLYSLSLEANHPNPFSHVTTFTYTIAEYGMVKLYLYDELGREIARIIDGASAQGTYSADFDGSKLAAGSYIVRLENGGGVVSRRVVVER
jgi:hypothetical protein